MNLQEFCFPVTERAVAVDDAIHPTVQLDDDSTYLPNDYKAIVREDTNEVISIVRSSYQIVKNSELINRLLQQLAGCGEAFRIDPSHSFVTNQRMRLQITFPDMRLADSESDIALSAFMHNSYDQSEGVRFYFGAIRSICDNGMVFGNVLSKHFSKHTSGFSFEDLSDKLEAARQHIPQIQDRVRRLESIPVNEDLVEEVEERISKKLVKRLQEEQELLRLTQWELLNRVTYWISHDVEQPHRARHQENVSKIFEL